MSWLKILWSVELEQAKQSQSEVSFFSPNCEAAVLQLCEQARKDKDKAKTKEKKKTERWSTD